MSHVLVVIAGPELDLTSSLLGELLEPLPKANRGAVTWLAGQKACEIPVFTWDGNGNAAAWSSVDTMAGTINEQVIAPARAKWPIDVALVPREARRKKLLIADMESTIIEQELIDEMAQDLGLGDDIAEVTARAMRGELDFAEALRARVAKFKGRDAGLLDDVFQRTVTLMPGAQTLVKTMNHLGAKTALVSGGFTVFTDRIGAELGFDHARGNTLEIVNGQITGTVIPPIIDRKGKAAALKELADTYDIAREETLAVGDGANDLDMIDTASLGVAFRAKPVVAKTADAAIQHGDLTGLLYLQGIPEDQFVRD